MYHAKYICFNKRKSQVNSLNSHLKKLAEENQTKWSEKRGYREALDKKLALSKDQLTPSVSSKADMEEETEVTDD